MEYLRVALPTRPIEVDITFSTPQPSLAYRGTTACRHWSRAR
jgi:hypothetical protein